MKISLCHCCISMWRATLYSRESRELGFWGHWRLFCVEDATEMVFLAAAGAVSCWGYLPPGAIGSSEQLCSNVHLIQASPFLISACHRRDILHSQTPTSRLLRSEMLTSLAPSPLRLKESEKVVMILGLVKLVLLVACWSSTPVQLEWSSSSSVQL